MPFTQIRASAHATHGTPPKPQEAAVGGAAQVPFARQQPPGHDVPSQTQAPMTQRCPTAQDVAVPHLQAPPAQLSAVTALHDVQLVPAVPHRETVGGAVQVPLKQQPVGQDVALQTQLPATHCCPMPQAAEPPHLHCPAALHASALVASHAVQTAPAVPQLLAVGGATQLLLPLQHPLGQLVGSQTQPPATHRCPAAHTVPAVPHAQEPAAHRSVVGGQTAHIAPPDPHAEAEVDVVHVVPLQHPDAHDVESQTHAPAKHRCPAPQLGLVPHRHDPSAEHASAVVASQAVHAEPATPHAATVLARQACVPSQHPAAQVVALQAPPVHTPAVHVWAAPHAGPLPHRQLPEVEHLSAMVGEQTAQVTPLGAQWVIDRAVQVAPLQQPVVHEVASQTHAPATQRCPVEHSALVPQAQVPLAEQPSEVAGAQAVHSEPAEPHVDSVRAVQTFPAQHPVGQEVLVQTQPPAPQV